MRPAFFLNICLAALVVLAPLAFSDDTAWLEQTKNVLQHPKEYASELDTLLPENNPYTAQANELAAKSYKQLFEQADNIRAQHEEEENKTDIEIYLLVTFGSPFNQAKIRSLMRALGDEKITLVVQGLPVGMQSLDDLINIMADLGEGIDAAPGLVLDPRRFQDGGITIGPTIVVEKNQKPIVWAHGVTDPAWILEKYEEGHEGNLGVHGPTERIAEKNFNDEIAERLAAVDWEKKKETAAGRFWQNKRYLDFPAAQRYRAFEFDLIYEVQEDMPGVDGRFLARAGDKINPVNHIDGTFYLIVFDASNPGQLVTARELGQSAPEGRRVKYLATRMEPRDDGWETKQKIEDYLDDHLYFISEQQAKTLRIQNVPATVQVSGQSLRITEYPPAQNVLENL